MQQPNMAKLNIQLTDASCNYDSVLIEILSIELITSAGDTNLPLNNPGIYNLLDLNNGLDTLLISSSLPSGTLSQIRLILGPNNHLVIDSITHDLKSPSAQQSGLKIQVHQELQAGISYEIWLDFDVCKSIVAKGNGGFSLKPVIRSFTAANSGAIQGIISPDTAVQYVFIVSNLDTIGTLPNPDGIFLLQGLDSGFYDVNFLGSGTYPDSTIFGVGVILGQITDLDTVSF